MTSERSKRRDFLTLVFISKSISKKLLIIFNLETKIKCMYVCKMYVCQSKVNSSLTCTHGQVTKHTTVKWPIREILDQTKSS